MKYVVFLGDGMADVPVPELNGKTPLEVAEHPNMDALAQRGLFGMVRNVPEGMKPGSDTANLSVFGYDPKIYYTGRSPLEAASIGIDLSLEDVTYRCNLVTLSEENMIEDATMIDYSAGEISTDEAKELIAAVNDRFETESLKIFTGISYRHCFVMRNAQEGAELTPPHDISKQSIRGRLPKGQNSELLREMIEYSYQILKDHPINRERVKNGKNPANAIWFWGEGRRPALPQFFEMRGLRGGVISAVDLIQGIGKCAGMRIIPVEGATGNSHTNFAGKGQAAIDALSTGCDYVYIHVEAPDECGHQCEIHDKVYSIEMIDRQIIRPVLEYLNTCGDSYVILLLPDHPTPVHLMTHTADPVPFVLFKSGDVLRDTSLRYTEALASTTVVFIADGSKLIERMLQK